MIKSNKNDQNFFVFENKELQRTNDIITALDRMKMTIEMRKNLNEEFHNINNELETLKKDLEMQIIRSSMSSSTEKVTIYSDITKQQK